MFDLVLVSSSAALIWTAGRVYERSRHRALINEWETAFKHAAQQLPSPTRCSGGGSSPELRSPSDPFTVTIKVKLEHQIHVIEGHIPLAEHLQTELPRMWLGWDIPQAPTDWEHIPETHIVASGLSGRFVARGDDELALQHLIETTYLDLLDVRRETRAGAASISVRQGHLRVSFYNIYCSSEAPIRLFKTTVKVAERLLDTVAPTP